MSTSNDHGYFDADYDSTLVEDDRGEDCSEMESGGYCRISSCEDNEDDQCVHYGGDK